MSGFDGLIHKWKEVARLIHTYEEAWQSKYTMDFPYPIQRIITVDEKVEAGNKVHTYNQVERYIEENDTIAVGTCYCRHRASLLGKDTHDMPMEACMWLGAHAEWAIDCLGARKVAKIEALELLDSYSEAGLVHLTGNHADGITYICNCDRWNCGTFDFIRKGVNVCTSSGFEPQFDADLCTACEVCIDDRCPIDALAMREDDIPHVDADLCFGCAVCATGCPEDAIRMVAKPGWEEPPQNGKAMLEAMITASSKNNAR
jgi:Pyruvate/2-oxoacid:ferredoxin oxidoreductase delta subunit